MNYGVGGLVETETADFFSNMKESSYVFLQKYALIDCRGMITNKAYRHY